MAGSTTNGASTSSPGRTRPCRGSTISAARTTSPSISNTASGYSFHQDARLRRLIRYRYNGAPLDVGGRFLYLRDDASGDVWCPTWQPIRSELDDYECRHGLGYTIITSRRAGIRSETTFVVPPGETLEVWRTTADERTVERRRDLAVRGGRVLPLGRPGRRHELPAQLVDRRGRGRGRRRLPQDGVPRAARPLRVLRQLRAGRRVRDVARRVPGTVPRLGPAPGRRGGPPGRHDRQRLAADRRAPRQAPARAGRDPGGHVRPRLRRESRGREVRPAGLPDDRQAAGPDASSPGRSRPEPSTTRSTRCGSSGRTSSPASRWRRRASTSTGWSTPGTPTSAW